MRTAFFGLAQYRPAPVTFGTIVEAGEPFGVEALDGIAQGLALDPDYARRLSPVHTLQGIGNSQETQCRTPPALLFRHAAQVRRRPQVRSDRDRSSHRSLLATTGDHKPITQEIPP